MALYSMKELLTDIEKQFYGINCSDAVNIGMIRAYINPDIRSFCK
jgi:hypothetical protein